MVQELQLSGWKSHSVFGTGHYCSASHPLRTVTDQPRPSRDEMVRATAFVPARSTSRRNARYYIKTLMNSLPSRRRQAKAGAPGRTRTDEYGFTKPVL